MPEFINRFTGKTIDFLNSRGAYTSTEEFNKRDYIFKQRLLERFIDFLPKNPIGIDIGAADGKMSNVMKDKKSIALDPLPQPNPKYQIPYIEAVAERLPFEDNSLDYATVLYSFHHFQEPQTAFKEIMRVLKPGGLLIAMVEYPRYPGQKYFLKINEQSVNEVIYAEGKLDKMSKYIESINHFTRKSFENLIRKFSLETLEAKTYSPTKWWDIPFKSSKNFYVLRIPS